MCRKAMSRDFFESDLPKPELSRDEDDFPAELLWPEPLLSCFGGTSFRMFTTLSTILVPISIGFTSSLLLAFALRTKGMELPLPLEVLTLEGEQDCCLRLPLELASTEDNWLLCVPGLPREAEAGRSGNDVFRFGGASSEKPGISEGFQGLDFTVGEVPRDGTGFFEVVEPDFDTVEERIGGADTLGALEGADGRRVGVADLDVDLEVGVADLGTSLGAAAVGLAVGVEERAVDLLGVEDLTVGVEDLTAEATGLEEGKVALEVGVKGLEGLAVVVKVGCLVGVAALVAEVRPPDDDGLLLAIPEEFSLDGTVGSLDATALLEAGSS